MMESSYQILARGGVDARLSSDRCVDHGEEGSGNLNDRNSAHEGRRDEPGKVPHDSSAKRDDYGVPAEPRHEHPVGQGRPHLAGLAGLAGGDGEDIYCMGLELALQRNAVQRVDVGVSDDGVSVGRSEFSDYGAGPGQESRLDPDRGCAQPDFAACGYQVTSPAPARMFATRASVKRRSDRRLR